MIYGAMNFPVKSVVEEIESFEGLGFNYLELAMDPPEAHYSILSENRNLITKALVAHDMGVVWEMCDRVLVMYAANIVEQGPLNDIFSVPAHPYTQGLLKSIPDMTGKSDKLTAIPGNVPSPMNYPPGCHFRDRCPYAFDRCAEEKPEFIELSPGHSAACFIAKNFYNKKDHAT